MNLGSRVRRSLCVGLFLTSSGLGACIDELDDRPVAMRAAALTGEPEPEPVPVVDTPYVEGDGSADPQPNPWVPTASEPSPGAGPGPASKATR